MILPIQKRWFEMIKTGQKKEEYREIKPYYDSRFKNYLSTNVPALVTFRNGYSNNSPSVKCWCVINKGIGKVEWGAIADKEYYVLKIISLVDY